jgi:hypothetical protein
MKPPIGNGYFLKLCQRLVTAVLIAGLSSHAFAVNPGTASPGGKSSGESEESSDEEESASDEGKDCDGTASSSDPNSGKDPNNKGGNGCTNNTNQPGNNSASANDSASENDSASDDDSGSPCSAEPVSPGTPSCIQEKIPLGIAPNEPGLGAGILKVYIDATGPNLGSREHLDFFGIPQMSITTVKAEGQKTNYSIVQAGSTLIPFQIGTSAGDVGYPMGASAYSQARLSFVGAGGAPADKSAAKSDQRKRFPNYICLH